MQLCHHLEVAEVAVRQQQIPRPELAHEGSGAALFGTVQRHQAKVAAEPVVEPDQPHQPGLRTPPGAVLIGGRRIHPSQPGRVRKIEVHSVDAQQPQPTPPMRLGELALETQCYRHEQPHEESPGQRLASHAEGFLRDGPGGQMRPQRPEGRPKRRRRGHGAVAAQGHRGHQPEYDFRNENGPTRWPCGKAVPEHPGGENLAEGRQAMASQNLCCPTPQCADILGKHRQSSLTAGRCSLTVRK